MFVLGAHCPKRVRVHTGTLILSQSSEKAVFLTEKVNKDFSLFSLVMGTGNFSLNLTFIQAKRKTYLLSWSQSGKENPQPQSPVSNKDFDTGFSVF